MTKANFEEVWKLLQQTSQADREKLFARLRDEFPIHALEEEWGVKAELILEAISRSQDLTKRGVRGVIAEAVFERSVVAPLASRGWRNETPAGDHAFDFLLVDEAGPVRIQVKMQRLEKGIPKRWSRNSQFYVAETQRTRSGTDNEGASTRPYRFGEFDVLAISMHPSCKDWTKFRYTVADWLLPRQNNEKHLIRVMQPVPDTPNADWFDDFEAVVQTFRTGVKKTIHEPPKR